MFKKDELAHAGINAKAMGFARHTGSHNKYDNFVLQEMEDIIEQNAGILNNPQLAHNKLKELSERLQDIIDANPNKKINDLFP